MPKYEMCINATVEIDAQTPEEAMDLAEIYGASLTIPEGIVTFSVPKEIYGDVISREELEKTIAERKQKAYNLYKEEITRIGKETRYELTKPRQTIFTRLTGDYRDDTFIDDLSAQKVLAKTKYETFIGMMDNYTLALKSSKEDTFAIDGWVANVLKPVRKEQLRGNN